MSRKSPGACHCLTQDPVYCSNPITQEDLLCDDCRDGCNAVFLPSDPGSTGDGFYSYATLGPHLKVTIHVIGGEFRYDL